MNLMDNKYLLFGTKLFDGKLVRNITELCLLPGVPSKYFSENYILQYNCEDDMLLEAISLDLYNDTSYWDILILLNDIRNVGELPVNGDIIFRRTEKALDDWVKVGKLLRSKDLTKQYDIIKNELSLGNTITLKSTPDDDNEIVARKYLDILEEQVIKNEKYRTLKYITLSDMSELLADLSILVSSPKIDKNIAILP